MKIFGFSNDVNKQKTINLKLLEELKALQKDLLTLKSPNTRSNAIKRNLLIQRAFRKIRDQNNTSTSETSSQDSDDPFTLNEQEMKDRLAALERKTRNQRDQIYDLEVQNDFLRDKRDQHQRLIKNFEKAKERLKKVNKSNDKVRSFW